MISPDGRARRLKAAALLALLVCLCVAQPALAERVVLSFAGDCTLGSMLEYQNYAAGFVQLVAQLGFEHPFSGVKHIFEADDLTLVNLEGTFTDAKKAQDKPFAFKAPPAYAQILPLGSVEAVNIANNHINDFFEEGKRDTLAALDDVGVVYSGEGLLAVYDVKGIRIGMTGYSYHHRNTLSNLANNDLPRLRAMGCDIIILSMHAGTEEQYKITGTQKDVARGAIDLGVDIVVGHHPHVIQAVEVYKGKPIFYSLGNFAFGGNGNPKDWDSMIGQVVLEVDEDGARLAEMHIIPCLISGQARRSDFRPVVATGEQREAILRKLRRYSPNIDPIMFETCVVPLGGE